MRPTCGSIILLLLVSLWWPLRARTQGSNAGYFAEPKLRGVEILRDRGYLAELVEFITDDGYVLSLTRARNPLINNGQSGLANKDPILFIHGILESPHIFVVNTFGAQPRAYTNISLSASSESDLNNTLGTDPGSKSLVTLALNFGHEVWLLHRRGMPGSQTRASPSSSSGRNSWPNKRFLQPLLDTMSQTVQNVFQGFFDYGDLVDQLVLTANKDFWNYSLDEQAQNDIPNSIDYILSQTGRQKLSIVGHSAGGTLTLMSLVLRPQLANKISRAILWAEAFNMGHGDLSNIGQVASPLLQAYIGPMPFSFTSTQIQALGHLICSPPINQRTICESFADLIVGFSGGQEPLLPEYIGALLFPTSSHELEHLLQCARFLSQHRYDYGRVGNQAAYNQSTPPSYDLSRVTLSNISFYTSSQDFTVSEANVLATLRGLKVPYKLHQINQSGVKFNHLGYFFHDDTARLAIIPSMIELETL